MRKRNLQLLTRFNKDEFKIIKAMVKQSGLSQEAFVRSALLGYKLKEAPPVEYFELIRLLRILNNNLNQIARQANSQGVLDAPKIRKEVENIRELEKTIHSAFAPSKDG